MVVHVINFAFGRQRQADLEVEGQSGLHSKSRIGKMTQTQGRTEGRTDRRTDGRKEQAFIRGSKEIAQGLGALAALTEHKCSIPSSHYL